MAKDEEEVVEIEDEDLSDEEVGDEEEGEEDDVGIFDEDLILEETISDENLLFGEEASDFFIGDTILSTGNGEVSWSKEDLEEVIRNERIEKNWQDSEEFVGGDFYDAVSGNFYGASNNRDGSYEIERGDDLYKGRGEGDLYNTGEVYSGKKNADGVYEAAKGMKSYDEIADNRHKGYSALESMGFEDKGKQEKRERRDFGKYDARKAA